jgi:prepilin peptidase CpaA
MVLAVTFGLFAIGGMGGGDAKLMAATSVWMGWHFVLVGYLVNASILGGLLTLLILSYRGSNISFFTGHHLFLRHFADRKAGIPYGIALGAAGLLAYPSTPLAEWAIAKLAGG